MEDVLRAFEDARVLNTEFVKQIKIVNKL